MFIPMNVYGMQLRETPNVIYCRRYYCTRDNNQGWLFISAGGANMRIDSLFDTKTSFARCNYDNFALFHP